MSQYLRRNDSASLNQEPTGSRWRELARKARLRVAYTVPIMTTLSRLRRQLSQREHIIKKTPARVLPRTGDLIPRMCFRLQSILTSGLCRHRLIADDGGISIFLPASCAQAGISPIFIDAGRHASRLSRGWPTSSTAPSAASRVRPHAVRRHPRTAARHPRRRARALPANQRYRRHPASRPGKPQRHPHR